MVRDTELAPDQITDPSQGPAIGLESGLEGALAEGLQDAVPLRGGQPGKSPRPVPAAKGSQPRGRMIAQLLGPLPNGPEADTQPSGDLGMSQATGSEQPSTLQPTFFNPALSKFARTPHHRNDAKTRAGEEATYLKLNNGECRASAGPSPFQVRLPEWETPSKGGPLSPRRSLPRCRGACVLFYLPGACRDFGDVRAME